MFGNEIIIWFYCNCVFWLLLDRYRDQRYYDKYGGQDYYNDINSMPTLLKYNFKIINIYNKYNLGKLVLKNKNNC